MERRLIAEYEATIDSLLADARPEQPRLAVQIAARARDDARLRPRQGKERDGRQGARGLLLAAYRTPASEKVAAE